MFFFFVFGSEKLRLWVTLDFVDVSVMYVLIDERNWEILRNESIQLNRNVKFYYIVSAKVASLALCNGGKCGTKFC